LHKYIKFKNKGNLDAVFGLANILLKRGEEDEALVLFKQAADQVSIHKEQKQQQQQLLHTHIIH
jgi:hypothetical protein